MQYRNHFTRDVALLFMLVFLYPWMAVAEILVQHGNVGQSDAGRIIAEAGQRNLDREQQERLQIQQLRHQREMQMNLASKQGLAGNPTYVRGHVRKDGAYVTPHYRSAADGNYWNNWSTKGNLNPYTGASGTRVTPPPVYGGYRPYSGGYTPSYIAPALAPPRDFPPLNDGWKMYRSRIEIKYAP